MKSRTVSLRLVLAVVVLMMAVSGIGLLVYNSVQYQALIHENQKNSVSQFLDNQVRNLFASAKRQITDVAMALQSRKTLREALRNRNRHQLIRILDNQFGQYLFSTGGIDLNRIYAFDANFNLIAKSSKGVIRGDDTLLICNSVIEFANARRGTERLKSLNQMCSDNQAGHLGILVSVGGFKVSGYLLYVVDAASILKELGGHLGMATQVRNPDGSIAHATADWEVLAQGPKNS